MEIFLSRLSGSHSVLKMDVAAQIVAFSLETDGGPPALLFRQPVHTGDAAGVVAPHGFGPEHLHAGAVHIGQAGPPHGGGGFPEVGLVAAAGGPVPVPQALGGGHRLLSAVAQAPPRGQASDIFRRSQHGQLSEPLAGQIQPFS